MLTLLKQRKISCILKVESLQRGISVSKPQDQQISNLSPLNTDRESLVEVERELEDIEKKM